jgi:type IV conjugative transfer system protein TraE
MEKTIGIANIEAVARQRNLFLVLTLMLSITLAVLSVKLMSSDEKIVLVPGLSQQVWVENKGVSKGYLEETTLMYLPLLLDLNPEIIQHKVGVIFKYISQSDPKYMKNIQEYFANAKEKYKKFGLSTYFSAKNLEVDIKALTVTANGTLTSRYGERGFETQAASYSLSYEWLGGHLRLKEFIRLPNETELREEKEKQKEQEAAAAKGEDNDDFSKEDNND